MLAHCILMERQFALGERVCVRPDSASVRTHARA